MPAPTNVPFFLGVPSNPSTPPWPVGSCETSSARSPQPTPFAGFITSTNQYGTLTICEWQCCDFDVSQGVAGDSVVVDGYGTLTAPTSFPRSSDGGDADHAVGYCDADNNFYATNYTGPGFTGVTPPDGKTYWTYCGCTNPDNKVAGHITYTALNNCYAIVTEGAGAPLVDQPIGTIVSIASLFNVVSGSFPIPSDDQKATYGYGSPLLCGPDAISGDPSATLFVLGLPNFNNT
jgi:hypothetical protein